MGDYTPLYWSLAIIFTVGIFIPLFVNSVVQEPQPEEINSLVAGVINTIENGITFDLGAIIGSFNINPFNILGPNLKQNLIYYLTAFGYLPMGILIPLIVITSIGVFYTVVKILPTT